MRRLVHSFVGAVAFMTRLPVPRATRGLPDELSSAAVSFPIVGLLIAAGAILLNHVLSRFVPHEVMVVIVLVYLVVITGGLHEDALADAADGFGGGWGKEQILNIMRDSRVGSFGALATTLALLVRFLFLANIPPQNLDRYLVAGQVTCRWTALPLAFFLPPAREQGGQGARVAGKISIFSLLTGTLMTLVILAVSLGVRALWAGLAAVVVTAVSGAYYLRRIGGVTGDCLGATNQLTEVVIYFAAVVLR